MAINVSQTQVNGQGASAGAAGKVAREGKSSGNDFFATFRIMPEARYRETDSGLKVAVLKQGSGESLTKGMRVKVNYTGWLRDGSKFDSSMDHGKLFEFTLGSGGVIKGWEEGMAGIKPGEKRQLIIPASLGYGKRSLAKIPPNSTLVFNVEAVAVEKVNPTSSPNEKGKMNVVA